MRLALAICHLWRGAGNISTSRKLPQLNSPH
jgi:hypothetical protein